MNCRHCQNTLHHVFLDLGFAPPSNRYLSKSDLDLPEITYPLKLYVCEICWLVQINHYPKAIDLFTNDYAYFSSISKSWLEHATNYATQIIRKQNLTKDNFVIEIASNDGYLLKNFVDNGIPCLGIEPTEGTAIEAERKGIPVLREFFGSKLAKKMANNGKLADLICGNNVYAHVPDINDFTKGLGIILKKNGIINLEFPHLMRLIENNQFDTVYHEHFSYLSLKTVTTIFHSAGLKIIDVEELSTHGGSLRIYACHQDNSQVVSDSVAVLLKQEELFGLTSLEVYKGFQNKANKVKNDFINFLIEQKRLGKTIGAYGAAAKGNTLMNYAGIKTDLIEFVCDAAPSKQGKYMPGNHLPIVHPSELTRRKPDWVVIFPWNISAEILKQFHEFHWGGRFVITTPELRILN